jgi:RES domain-containing protein
LTFLPRQRLRQRLRSGQDLSLWRISKRKYADTAFSGEGARRVDGRWNSRGQGMVYTKVKGKRFQD